jgi:mannose-6-phosphate isomerase-like protein (cupin superfamily)
MLCYQGKEGVFTMRFKADITLKKWGSEETIKDPIREISLKILKMDILKQTSWHYHAQKESYFYILSGEVSIHISDNDDLNLAHIELLKQGDCIFVGANKRHMITAMKESVLLESSNYDDSVDKTIVHH